MAYSRLTRACCVLGLGVFSAIPLHGQQDTSSVRVKHRGIYIAGVAAVYGGGLFALNKLWYEGSERLAFHFFDDLPEWQQVDKLGHFYTAFYASAAAHSALRYIGTPSEKAIWYGAMTGALALLPIEVMDGFSSDYGASVSDAVADLAGAGFFGLQLAVWDEVRIAPRFSVHFTDFAKIRPDVLGRTTIERALKDYNGQTYWLSFDMDRFHTGFPRWLNLAIGYGGTGMVYSRASENNAAGYQAHRQYFLGIDFDLKAIPTRSRFLATVLRMGGMIRLPAPAVELQNGTLRFHALYF